MAAYGALAWDRKPGVRALQPRRTDGPPGAGASSAGRTLPPMVDATEAPPDLGRDGYALLPGLLDAAEVARCRGRADALVAAPPAPGCERPNNTLLPLRFDDPLVHLVLAPAGRRDAIRRAAGAADLRWISGYLSVKAAGSAALWWHQDWWCWGHPVSLRPRPPQVALLCYLTATDDRSGALRVLPASHRRATPLHRLLPEAHAGEALALDPGHPAMSDHPGQRTLRAAPGDAVLADYRLLHGTHANHGPRRDCLLLSFAPDWAALPSDVRGHLVQHPAQPGPGERWPDGPVAGLLPRHDGPLVDLPVDRHPPEGFALTA